MPCRDFQSRQNDVCLFHYIAVCRSNTFEIVRIFSMTKPICCQPCKSRLLRVRKHVSLSPPASAFFVSDDIIRRVNLLFGISDVSSRLRHGRVPTLRQDRTTPPRRINGPVRKMQRLGRRLSVCSFCPFRFVVDKTVRDAVLSLRRRHSRLPSAYSSQRGSSPFAVRFIRTLAGSADRRART